MRACGMAEQRGIRGILQHVLTVMSVVEDHGFHGVGWSQHFLPRDQTNGGLIYELEVISGCGWGGRRGCSEESGEAGSSDFTSSTCPAERLMRGIGCSCYLCEGR